MSGGPSPSNYSQAELFQALNSARPSEDPIHDFNRQFASNIDLAPAETALAQSAMNKNRHNALVMGGSPFEKEGERRTAKPANKTRKYGETYPKTRNHRRNLPEKAKPRRNLAKTAKPKAKPIQNRETQGETFIKWRNPGRTLPEMAKPGAKLGSKPTRKGKI